MIEQPVAEKAHAVDARLRLDKWLWHARVCKSRTLAGKLCEAGRVRVSGTLVHKASFQVRAGDVVTLPWGPRIRVLRIRALAERRGPPAEARTLYEDLTAPAIAAAGADAPGARPSGAGRPTKAERRAIERLKGTD